MRSSLSSPCERSFPKQLRFDRRQSVLSSSPNRNLVDDSCHPRSLSVATFRATIEPPAEVFCASYNWSGGRRTCWTWPTALPHVPVRIWNNPGDLCCGVMCACLCHIVIYCSKPLCLFCHFYLHHSMYWRPMFANTVKIFCEVGRLPCCSSMLWGVQKKGVLSYLSPLILTTRCSCLERTASPLPHVLQFVSVKSNTVESLALKELRTGCSSQWGIY